MMRTRPAAFHPPILSLVLPCLGSCLGTQAALSQLCLKPLSRIQACQLALMWWLACSPAWIAWQTRAKRM